jgi:opacity protein-like surface antigen
MKNLMTISFMALLPIFAASQSKWEGGLNLGLMTYGGDLVQPAFTLKESKFAAGLFARRELSNLFNARLNFLFGKIAGSDNNYDELVQRNISFESPVMEFALIGEYEFLGKMRLTGDSLHRPFSPYLFLGAGMSIINPDTDFSKVPPGSAAAADQDDHASFSNTQFVMPLGLGLKYGLNSQVSIGLEYGIRLVWTDYLDGVSQAGNPDKNDVYFAGGLTLAYRFAKKEHL